MKKLQEWVVANPKSASYVIVGLFIWACVAGLSFIVQTARLS